MLNKPSGSVSERIAGLLNTENRPPDADLLYSIHELSRIISARFDTYMAPHDLTHSQWWALMFLFRNEGCTQVELASLMAMGRPATGKLLERMEAKGWVERRADPEDNRVKRVHLAEGVIPVFDTMRIEGRKVFEYALEGLSATDLKRAKSTLEQIKNNYMAR